MQTLILRRQRLTHLPEAVSELRALRALQTRTQEGTAADAAKPSAVEYDKSRKKHRASEASPEKSIKLVQECEMCGFVASNARPPLPVPVPLPSAAPEPPGMQTGELARPEPPFTKKSIADLVSDRLKDEYLRVATPS